MSSLLNPVTWKWKSCGLLIVVLTSMVTAGCGEKVVDAPPAKVAFETSLFRILDVNLPPGTTLRHTYPNGAALVVMTDGGRIRTRPPGKEWGDEMAAGAGSVTVAESGELSVQNVGDTAVQLMALENLRPGSGATGAPLAGKGMTPVGESASLRVYDAQLVDGNTQVSHVHAAPAVTILIRGKALTQGPENKDKALGELASGLKQLDRPGQWIFVPAGDAQHYVVRLALDPTRIVEVELK